MGSPGPLAPPRCPRYLSLDLWRGVACLLVVLHHAPMYSRFWYEGAQIPEDSRGNIASWFVSVTSILWLGVPIFFVISGYCIAATADATRRRPRPLGTYFMRRFRRIYPPYWFSIVLLLIFTGVIDRCLVQPLWSDSNWGIPRPSDLNAWQWVGNLTLTERWRAHIIGGPPQYFHGMSWTLCYEEQFYAVVGFMLALAPRRFFLAAWVVTAACTATMLLVPWSRIDGFFFDGHWLAFAAGILVYYRVNYADRLGKWLVNGALVAGTLLYGRTFFPVHQPHANLGETIFVALAFALLLSLLHPWDRHLASARLLRPLMFCGTICYSLYLIHWPVVKGVAHAVHLLGLRSDTEIVLVTVPLGVAASVAVSWLFYVLVEKRFLNPPQSQKGEPPGLSRRDQPAGSPGK
jgi:peptidoglycan/LPS O-acetylase OafA/YrhL